MTLHLPLDEPSELKAKRLSRAATAAVAVLETEARDEPMSVTAQSATEAGPKAPAAPPALTQAKTVVGDTTVIEAENAQPPAAASQNTENDANTTILPPLKSKTAGESQAFFLLAMPFGLVNVAVHPTHISPFPSCSSQAQAQIRREARRA